jgi:hypothetical protein
MKTNGNAPAAAHATASTGSSRWFVIVPFANAAAAAATAVASTTSSSTLGATRSSNCFFLIF